MEALASKNDFVTYTYTGKSLVKLDNHHDKYEIDIGPADQFDLSVIGTQVVIIHEDEPKIRFKTTISDKAYQKLIKYSTPNQFQFLPHPKYPSYPFLQTLTFEMVAKLYAYFNDKYFNGMCPKNLLFKKSQGTKAPLGVAEYNMIAGKPLYRMTVNLKRIGTDLILFVDTLLHEMIHLYLYRKGLLESNNNIIQDGHGRFFQAEMNRLNKLGFNISIVLEWEKREIEADVEINVIRVVSPQYPNHAKYYWSLHSLEDHFDSLVRQIRENDPTKSYVIDLVVTKDDAMRGYEQITLTGRIPSSKLPLWWNVENFKGRVVRTFNVAEEGKNAAIGKLKVPKKEEPFYSLPFSLFASWCRRNKATGTDDQLRPLWESYPMEKILPYAEQELLDIHRAIARGMADQEVKRKLTAVYARFDGRCTQHDYRVGIRKIIDQKKLEGLLSYPQLGL